MMEHLPELVQAGLVAAQRQGRGWAVPLEGLVRFSRTWLLSTELIGQVGPLQPFRTKALGERDVATRHLTVWPRDDAG